MTLSRCWPALVALLLLGVALVPAASAETQVAEDGSGDHTFQGTSSAPGALDIVGVFMDVDGDNLVVSVEVAGPLDSQGKAHTFFIRGAWSVFFTNYQGVEYSVRARPFFPDVTQSTFVGGLCSDGSSVNTNNELTSRAEESANRVVWTLPITQTDYDFRGPLTGIHAVTYEVTHPDAGASNANSCGADTEPGRIDRGPDSGAGLPFVTSDLPANLEVVPAEDRAEVAPGGTVTFDVAVNNSGPADANATFAAEVPEGWEAAVEPAAAAVAAGEDADVSVTLTAPDDVGIGEEHPWTFRVLDGDDELASAELTAVVAEAASGGAFSLSADPEAADAAPGESVTYTITASNPGEEDLVLSLSLSGDNGWATLDASNLTVPAGGSAEAAVTVAVPDDAAAGPVSHSVTATDGDGTASVTLTTTVAEDADVTEGEATPGFGVLAALAAAGVVALLGRRRRGR